MLELLVWASTAAASPVTVVTFDNGEFNAPLYSPRWNGRWRQPSVAQELATSVARITGDHPRVFTYMPPGRVAGRPGELHPVLPVRPGCDGPSERPEDACWCSPADNCWGTLQANYHPEGSTSLVRTVSSVRALLADDGPAAARFEVHFTDFFEEDPAAAENPADSDRCVTASGVRRALAGLLALPEGESLDHVTFGLLRVRIEPPPPGGGWGYTYELAAADDTCWSGTKGRPWNHRADPLDFVMGMVVLGVGTAADPQGAVSFLEGLEDQLTGEHSTPRLITLSEPVPDRVVDTVVTALDADPWRVPPLRDAPRVPCGRVDTEVRLASAEGALQLDDVQGRCDGQVGVAFAPGELRRHFLRTAGLDPFRSSLLLEGEVRITASPEALTARLGSLDALDEAERALPLWRAAASAVDPAGQAQAAVQPWQHAVRIERLEITGLDTRPWLLVSLVSTMFALMGGLGTAAGLRQVHAARAMRACYEASAREDPLHQRPLSTILAEAQQQVARGWVIRALTGTLVGAVLLLASFWSLMTAYRMFLG